MVLNDCCSCARAGGARTTASNATAKAQSFVTAASSNRAVDPRGYYGGRGPRHQSSDTVLCWRLKFAPPARAGSSAGGEEAAQQGRGFGLADAAVDLGPVQAGGRREKAHAALDRAALGIGGAVIEPPDPGEPDRRPAPGGRPQPGG